MLISTLLITLLITVGPAVGAKQRPNIIIVLADDLGWNDVSFHGSNQIPTPNIDALAYNGIILNSHYVPALCTPSRSSLLTGKYPTSIGMQHLVILAPEPWGLPLSEQIMPEYFRAAGYRTHAIGKWHLGFFKKEYTPLYRGFDTHFGYWNGYQDYYNHTMRATHDSYTGYDMRRDMEVDWSAVGKYSTDLFTDEAINLIKKHNTSQGPLFMYLAHLAPHAGNDAEPYQADDRDITKFAHIEDPERRVYAAMVSKLDESLGAVMTALRGKGMLDNSIILFMSDNGAPTQGIHSNRGSNWPLRGMKDSPMEGGVRGVTAIWSPLLNRTQRVSNQLMHVSDWLPTFYSAAGMDVEDLGNIDGFDMWKTLSDDLPSPRTEIIHNIDDIANYVAIREGDWKYISGTTQGGRADSWFGESGEDIKDYDLSAILQSPTSSAITGLITKLQIKEKEERLAKIVDNESSTGKGKVNGPKVTVRRRLLSKSTITNLRKEATLICPNITDSSNASMECQANVSSCLFNIREDPCERRNLAKLRPLITQQLEDAVRRLRKSVVEPKNVPADPNANPALWNGIWVAWLDEDVDTETSTPPYIVVNLPPNPVTILTILASLFGVIILILMAIILRLYLCEMPGSCSLFSIFLFKDSDPIESFKQKNVE